MWKRVSLTLLVLFVAIAGLTFWRVARAGQGDVEAWVGGELKEIVNARGTLTLGFDSIDYQYPRTLVVKNLRLDRPAADGGAARPMFEVRGATVELDEIPRRGRPIVVRAIDLDRPVVHVEMFTNRPAPGLPAATRPALSQIIKLRRVTIRGGQIEYDDGSGSPLTWSDLDADLALDPVNDHAHRVKLAIDQPPLMSVHLDGEVDLDAIAVSGLAMSAKLDLNDPAAVRFFTPPLQRFLVAREVRGRCAIEASGDASMREPTKNALTATATLAGGHVAVGAYHFPLDRLTCKASLRGPAASIDELSVAALGGMAVGNAKLALDDQRRITGGFTIGGLHLEQLVRNRAADQPSRLAGDLDADVSIHTDVAMLKLFKQPEGSGVVWGDGTLSVRKGRLVNLPIIGDLIAATRKVTNLIARSATYDDRFEATFDLVGKRLDCSQMTYVGDLIAARGKGSFASNGDVDLAIHAGPLEGIQERLGPVGDLWGKVTDHVMTYRVTGKLKSPEVRPTLGDG